MSRMTRRNVPSRKVRPSTRYSHHAPASIVVVINMADNGERWVGRTVRGTRPRLLGMAYYWTFPIGTFDEFRRGPRWLNLRNRSPW